MTAFFNLENFSKNYIDFFSAGFFNLLYLINKYLSGQNLKVF